MAILLNLVKSSGHYCIETVSPFGEHSRAVDNALTYDVVHYPRL